MPDTVTLKGGIVVRVEALKLALALEAAGHTFTVKTGRLLVSNGAVLGPACQAELREFKDDLVRITRYRASPGPADECRWAPDW